MIKKAVILACLLLLVFGTAQAQSTPQESERMRFAAQTGRDTLTLGKLLDADLLYIHSNTLTESRRDFIRSVASGKIIYQRMTPIGTPTLRRYGKISILDGSVEVEGTYSDQPFTIKLRYTSVYRRVGKAWKLLSWQSTKIM